MSDFFSQVASGALESGVNYSTFIAINVALFAVILSLILLLAASLTSNPALVPHVCVLIFLAIGLWGLIVYVVNLTGLSDCAQQQQSEADAYAQQDAVTGRAAADQQQASKPTKAD